MLKMCTVKLAYKGGKISQSRKYPLMNNYFCSSSNSSSFCISLYLSLSFFFLSVFYSLCLFIFSVYPFGSFLMSDSLKVSWLFCISLSLLLSVCFWFLCDFSLWFYLNVWFSILFCLFCSCFSCSLSNTILFFCLFHFCMSVVLFYMGIR